MTVNPEEEDNYDSFQPTLGYILHAVQKGTVSMDDLKEQFPSLPGIPKWQHNRWQLLTKRQMI